jgi:hypothetical protein
VNYVARQVPTMSRDITCVSEGGLELLDGHCCQVSDGSLWSHLSGIAMIRCATPLTPSRQIRSVL